MTIATPQQLATAILQVIPDHRRWVRGKESSSGGTRHCVLGAIYTITNDMRIRHAFSDLFFDISLAEYIKSNITLFGKENQITFVNDYPGITYKDIRKILEKVAAKESPAVGTRKRYARSFEEGSGEE